MIFFLCFNSFGDIPVRTGSGICHKRTYKKWAGLGWAGLPATLSSETAPRWLCPKTPFPKKTKKLLAFGFVWLDHHTSHITHIRYLSSTVAIRHRHPASSIPTKIASEPHISCLNCSPYKMLKCKKGFSLSLSVAQVQAQKTWFVEEAYIWSWSQV